MGKYGYNFKDLKGFVREMEYAIGEWDDAIERAELQKDGYFESDDEDDWEVNAECWEVACQERVMDAVECGLIPKKIKINVADAETHIIKSIEVLSALYPDEVYWYARNLLEETK